MSYSEAGNGGFVGGMRRGAASRRQCRLGNSVAAAAFGHENIADIGRSTYAKSMNRSAAVTSLLSFSLAACSPSGDYFSVADEDGDIRSVEVHICKKVVELPEREVRFSDHINIDCEGSGEVHVQMDDGREITCLIGYVTPGASQHFGYEIKDGECQSDGIAI